MILTGKTVSDAVSWQISDIRLLSASGRSIKKLGPLVTVNDQAILRRPPNIPNIKLSEMQ